ncbi:2-amino-4-hydroxy-6-hydroxymethyldihydropteridine pyrophosphokinase [Oceaniovalibus guishaninsula JLT2003]|uniref:2-amino-4-hydroxy-6-hydroxymethyldihydropteridine pyrophosphokinase n=1 Tax=Oceaniovalibus guishaninsula JLT2003 TaxID=1231392 RepID=K2I5A7_9RHOB|nr:2-amino-4-hydroxy-6-hydroxymethyldihydropteridine diphosphokinase [Oceaniovalibus guishaninsula]EKE44090.1 2-amino-4-hydroxy-6-hydroxymethyldihydropteridine pyrophosphokinase [Oceaniovalibus guishaninsula JLT2003]
MPDFYIAIGANLPMGGRTPGDTVAAAAAHLDVAPLRLVALSPVYRTPAFPPGSGPDFANAAALCKADLAPTALLDRLHGVERAMGRVRTGRWGARVIDLDLLAAGDAVLPDAATFRRWHDLPAARQRAEAPDGLVLPHPRLQDRAFVLVPLADIAPDWRHPVTGRTVRAMRDALPAADLAAIRPW